MKTLITLFAILSLTLIAAAQPPETLWIRTYGGSNVDEGHCVQQTSDGGYVITGYTSSYGAGNNDVYLIKTDANGIQQWYQTYGGYSDDFGWSVQQTSDYGYIIAGSTHSFGAGSQVYLIKTDALGDEAWHNTFGGSQNEIGYSVQQTSDGYVIAGWTQSFGYSVQVYLIKTDVSGNEVWHSTFGGSNEDYGYSLQQTSDGGYVIAGSTQSFGAGSQVYLIKTDALGDEVWHNTFGGSNIDDGRSVRQTSDGGYIIAGYTYSYGAVSQVYLIRTDASGNEVWHNTFGGSNDEYGYSVRQTSDGGYIIAGWTSSYGAGNHDIYLIKTNAAGNETWHNTFGGSNYEYGYSVQQTSDGGYVIAGWTNSYGSISQVYLVKTDAEETPSFITDGALLLNTNAYTLAWEEYSGADHYDVEFIFQTSSSSKNPDDWPGWSNNEIHLTDIHEESLNITPENLWDEFPAACDLNIVVTARNSAGAILGTMLNIVVTYGRLTIPVNINAPPVLLLHGIWSDSSAWDDFKVRLAEEDDYAPWILEYPNTGSIPVSAGLVKYAIDYIEQTTGITNTTYVVAHSMGGLVARCYCENMATNRLNQLVPYQQDDIAGIAMIGTPNEGGRLDVFVDILNQWTYGFGGSLVFGIMASTDPAIGQLLPGNYFLEVLNNAWAGSDPPPIYVVAGYNNNAFGYFPDLILDYQRIDWRYELLRMMYDFLVLCYSGGPNDVMVNTSSAVFLPEPALPHFYLDYNHGDLLKPQSQSDQRYTAIRGFLQDPQNPPYQNSLPPWVAFFGTIFGWLPPVAETVTLPGALVQLTSGTDTLVAFADQNGHYEFPYLPPGAYNVSIYADGFIVDFMLDTLSPEVPQNWQNFSLDFDSTYNGPIAPAIFINGGNNYTNSTAVILDFSVFNAAEVLVSEDPNFIGASWQPIPSTNQLQHIFNDTTGMIIYAKYRSSAQIESDLVLDGITYIGYIPTGRINVTSTPDSAEVFVDGASTGLYTPAGVDSLPVGTYRVSVVKSEMVPDPLYEYVTLEMNGQGYANFTLIVSVSEDELNKAGSSVANKFALTGAFPNPFNPTTVIRFTLPEISPVTLKVYDISGRVVGVQNFEHLQAGTHEIPFDGSGLASGVYLYRLTAGENTASGKMVLLK